MIEYACHTCGESYPEGHRWDDEDNCTDCQSEQAPKGLTSYKLTILSSFTGQTWTGEYMDGASGEALLENIFRYFNRVTVEDGERLERHGFRQPSLSAGDVVHLDPQREDARPTMFIVGMGCRWHEVWPGMGLANPYTAVSGRVADPMYKNPVSGSKAPPSQ